MEWNFIAKNPDELASIGNALFTASKQKHLDEQVQMTRLLEAVSALSILHKVKVVKGKVKGSVLDIDM